MNLLDIVEISKGFGNIIALDNVSLSIRRGEILGILGENGSGKSTLAKILYGIYTPDRGFIRLYMDNKEIRIFSTSVKCALEHGIIMISQRPQLVDELSVIENIALSLGTSLATTKRLVNSTLSRFNINIDLTRIVATLSYTEKQFVELVKALSFKPKLLIADEITTYLPKDIREKFYDILKMFADSGGSVLFITHKISEAVEICNRIAVLRRGKIVNIFSKENDISIDLVRRAMFGEIDNKLKHETSEYMVKNTKFLYQFNQKILRVEDLVILDDYSRKAVNGISFSVDKGIIYSIVGISGNGQKELCEGIAGLRKISRGRIFLESIDITRLSPAKRVLKGLVYIPEDPFRDSVAMDLAIAENLRLFSQVKLDDDSILSVLSKLRIQPPDPRLKVYKLSGGNIQKISISRLMLRTPKCVIIYNPTRMLDEASSEIVKAFLKDLARKGIGVILVTEDVNEALDIADIVSVISHGKIIRSFNVNNLNIREELEKAMVTYG